MKITQLGDYVLEKRVGSGGMGEVYRARQVSLDRTVAVKVLPRSLASQPGFTERFTREARAAANLIHPNVIQVYSIGLDKGIPYFAMEFVEGEDLQQRIKRQRKFEIDEIVRIIHGTSSALQCAHEKGIVHRDIKPSNVMFDRSGNLKVMDFGLAKITTGNSNLTQSGLIMGTPNYMSPEQGKGEPTDTRSDIYSLGVVFYELLTGALPFRADTPTALIYKHAYEKAPPPREKNPEIPPFIESICLKMIAKDPNDRYATPKDLIADLEEFQRDRNFYMSSGMPDSKELVDDQTILDDPNKVAAAAASGRSPTQSGPRSAVMSQTATGATGGQSTVAAQTVSQTAPGVTQATQAQTLIQGQTMAPYPQRRSGGLLFFAAIIVVAVALGALFPDKVRELYTRVFQPVEVAKTFKMPLTDLYATRDKVSSKINISWLPFGRLEFIPMPNVDRDVEPGAYRFRLSRAGYLDAEFGVELLKTGQIEPSLDHPTIRAQFENMKPGTDLLNAYNDGARYLGLQDWERAREALDRAYSIEPDFTADKGSVRELRDKVEDGVRRYEEDLRKPQNKFTEAGSYFEQKALNQARDAYLACKELCLADGIRGNSKVVDLRILAEQRITSILTQLENLERDRDLAAGHFERGEFSDAVKLYNKIAAANIDDAQARQKAAECDQRKAEYADIEARFATASPEQDQETKRLVDAYLKICTQHAAAKKLRDDLVARMDARKGTQERIAQNLASIVEIMNKNPKAADWMTVVQLADAVLALDPENAVAKAHRDRALREVNDESIELSFQSLAAGLLTKERDKRMEVFRLLVPDVSFELMWQTFFTAAEADGLELIKTGFVLQDKRVEGDTATIVGLWNFEIALHEYGKKVVAVSKIEASLSRTADLRWVIKKIARQDGSKTEASIADL